MKLGVVNISLPTKLKEIVSDFSWLRRPGSGILALASRLRYPGSGILRAVAHVGGYDISLVYSRCKCDRLRVETEGDDSFA